MSDRARTAALVGLGAGLLTLAGAVDRLGDLQAHNASYVALQAGMAAVALPGAALLWRRARRRDMVIVLAVALAARLFLVVDAPTLSDDAYRFVWDGRVQAAGINPYDHAPAAAELIPLRDFEIFTEVNRPYTRTLYPPANELAYLAVHEAAGDGIPSVKWSWLALEALAVALLLVVLARVGVSSGRVALYAWHPLAVVEIAGSGHPDPLLLALTLGALLLWDGGRRIAGGAALAAAALTKFVPLLLAPFMVRRGGLRFAVALGATAVLLYLPYAGAGTAALGSVSEFADERFGAGPYRWLTGLGVGDSVATTLLLAGLAAFVAWTAARPPSDLAGACRYAALLFGGAVLASNHVEPWYLLWALPFLCVAPVPGLLWATAAVSAFYLDFGPNRHVDQDLISFLVWGPAVALLAADALRSLFRRAEPARPLPVGQTP